MGKLAARDRAGIQHEHELVRMEDEPENDGSRQGEGDRTTKINPPTWHLYAWQPTSHKLEALEPGGAGKWVKAYIEMGRYLAAPHSVTCKCNGIAA